MNKKNLLLGIISVVVLIAIVILISANKNEEEYFNQVELSENNFVLNSTELSYYDTIIKVGLDAAGLKGISVNVLEISDVSKNAFDGELKAHIKLFNGQYYLFIDKFDRIDAIEIISHEIVHIDQYNSTNLIYESGTIIYWLGKEYDVANLDYDRRPWEQDAFDRQGIIQQSINRTLYTK